MSGQHLYRQRRGWAPEPTAEIERLLFHWPNVMRAATDDWARGFSLSIWKQSSRRGWHPSPKQFSLMQKMVKEFFANGGKDEVALIEE